jgi:hypothetical protein
MATATTKSFLLGVNFAPRGELCILEGMFNPWDEHSLLFSQKEGRTEGNVNYIGWKVWYVFARGFEDLRFESSEASF